MIWLGTTEIGQRSRKTSAVANASPEELWLGKSTTGLLSPRKHILSGDCGGTRASIWRSQVMLS